MKWYTFWLAPEDGLHRASSVAIFCCVRTFINTEGLTERVTSVCLILVSVLIECITLPLPSLFGFMLLLLGFVVVVLR